MKYIPERIRVRRDGGHDAELGAPLGHSLLSGVADGSGARLDLPLPGRHGDAGARQHHPADVRVSGKKNSCRKPSLNMNKLRTFNWS